MYESGKYYQSKCEFNTIVKVSMKENLMTGW